MHMEGLEQPHCNTKPSPREPFPPGECRLLVRSIQGDPSTEATDPMVRYRLLRLSLPSKWPFESCIGSPLTLR